MAPAYLLPANSTISTQIRLAARDLVEARRTMLAHAQMNGRNVFDRATEVRPVPLTVKTRGNRAEVGIPVA